MTGVRNDGLMPVAIHFFQSKAARSLSLAQVFRLTDLEAETKFREIRWSETAGEAVCPHCGGLDPYSARRPSGLLRFRCKACRKDFTITSGTLFASHKAPLRFYLAAIAVFMNEVKGKNALALSRDLGMSHKACWFCCTRSGKPWRRSSRGVSWAVWQGGGGG
jgi:transposase-like protein